MYVQFNARNAGCPMDARLELDDLIGKYLHCSNPIFIDFANLLIKYHDYIINSFVMVQRNGPGKIYNSRLSNGPIESLNRKIKDLKRLGRGYTNFDHFRSRFLFATRNNPVLNGSSNFTPIHFYEDDELQEEKMENFCAFSKKQLCLKWTDYCVTRHELEEADLLCHENWIEIERKPNISNYCRIC